MQRAMKTKANAATLAKLNAGLETFNDKSAMNFDGPGEWVDWAVTSVETDAKRHVVKVKAGKKRVTLKLPASLALLHGDEASLEFILRVTDLVDDDTEDPNAGRLAPVAAPKLSDAGRRELREQQERERLARIAAMEAEEAAAQKPPTRAALEKALAKRTPDDFQTLLERTNGALRKTALELMFKKKKNADFIAEAIRPVLSSVKLNRKQWALVATAELASSVVLDYASARA